MDNERNFFSDDDFSDISSEFSFDNTNRFRYSGKSKSILYANRVSDINITDEVSSKNLVKHFLLTLLSIPLSLYHTLENLQTNSLKTKIAELFIWPFRLIFTILDTVFFAAFLTFKYLVKSVNSMINSLSSKYNEIQDSHSIFSILFLINLVTISFGILSFFIPIFCREAIGVAFIGFSLLSSLSYFSKKNDTQIDNLQFKEIEKILLGTLTLLAPFATIFIQALTAVNISTYLIFLLGFTPLILTAPIAAQKIYHAKKLDKISSKDAIKYFINANFEKPKSPIFNVSR